ncbi:hypothetical protein LWI29_030666 [Acer saccharum]|uniref:Uncharacterized protein n=1 Tax=Acer saccharum TaxID=4024 RepID=A0AA39VGV0_ACESA|nr:hypothetical protein LWI29_030666 [Acer saccharum]
MTILRRQSNYTKLDKEDPEEIQRRKAQFLIYKVMEQADSIFPSPRKRRPSSFLRLRLCRLKVKIGKRLRKSIYAARISFHKQGFTSTDRLVFPFPAEFGEKWMRLCDIFA